MALSRPGHGTSTDMMKNINMIVLPAQAAVSSQTSSSDLTSLTTFPNPHILAIKHYNRLSAAYNHEQQHHYRVASSAEQVRPQRPYSLPLYYLANKTNRELAATHEPLPTISEIFAAGGSLPKYLVLTCADPRCDPRTFLGIQPGGKTPARRIPYSTTLTNNFQTEL
jgi:hypothetical protein